MEFLAEGDLLRPTGEAGSTSVASEVVWQVLEPTRLAVRDGDFLLSVQPWPEVTAQLLRRQERRAEWLSNVLAISHLPCVDCGFSCFSGSSPTAGGRSAAVR